MKKLFLALFYLILSIVYLQAIGEVRELLPQNNTIEILKTIKKQLRVIDQLENEERNKTLIKECGDYIDKGINYLNNNPSFFVPEEFNKSLRGLAEFTERIIKVSPADRVVLIEQLSIDLKLKFGQRSGKTQATINSALVPATIRALYSDGSDAKFFRVHYAPLGEEIDLSKQYEVYPTLTTPTAKSIIPGFYKFWVKKDGEQEIRSELNYEVPAEGATIEMTVKNK